MKGILGLLNVFEKNERSRQIMALYGMKQYFQTGTSTILQLE